MRERIFFGAAASEIEAERSSVRASAKTETQRASKPPPYHTPNVLRRQTVETVGRQRPAALETVLPDLRPRPTQTGQARFHIGNSFASLTVSQPGACFSLDSGYLQPNWLCGLFVHNELRRKSTKRTSAHGFGPGHRVDGFELASVKKALAGGSHGSSLDRTLGISLGARKRRR